MRNAGAVKRMLMTGAAGAVVYKGQAYIAEDDHA